MPGRSTPSLPTDVARGDAWALGPARRRAAMLLVASCFALGLALSAAEPATAWDPATQGHVGRAVEGVDEVRALAPAGVRVEEYENAGYRLTRHDDEIRVSVEITPLGSSSPWAPPAEWSEDATDEPIPRLVRSLTAGASTQYEAASRILGWVARNVEYELDRDASQEAADVLHRRSAYCTGLARLAVALLESAGLEAREVAGWVVSEGNDWGAAAGQPQGFHRWVEVRYSDVGWVFSDPLYAHHFVPATYLRLASETVRPEEGLEGLLLERRDRLVAVDLFPAAPPGVQARRNDRRQVAASLHVEMGRATPGVAILEGESVRLTHALVDGATTFLGLEPGRYRLEVQIPGRPVVRRRVVLRDRHPGRVSLAPARNAALRPAVTHRRAETRAAASRAAHETEPRTPHLQEPMER